MTEQSNNQKAFNNNQRKDNQLNSIFEYSFINKHTMETPSTISQNQEKAVDITDFIQETVKSNHCKPSIKENDHSYISNTLLSYSLLYEREKERGKVRKRKLGNERSLKKINEEKELKSFPVMNNVSKCLIGLRQKTHDSPLYLKQEIIKEKQTINLRYLIQNENDRNEIGKNKVFNQKGFDDFIKANCDLITKKKNHINKRQIEIEEEISNQSTPRINNHKKNIKLVQLRKNSKNSTCANSYSPSPIESPISQFHLKRKIVKCNKKRDASFTPMINSKSQSKTSHKPHLLIEQKANQTYSNNQTKQNKNNAVNHTQNKPSQSSVIQSYNFKSNISSHNQRLRMKTNQFKLKQQQSTTKEVVFEQKESSSEYGLYPLNIRSNLSSQEAQTVITLNKKHNNIIESYFLS